MTAHSHPIEEAGNQGVGASALPTGLSSAAPIEPASPSRPKASIPSRDDWKGGFDKSSWMGRYAEQMMRFGGMQPYEAECWALNAWEASANDADPDEAAEADIAYSADDAA